MSEEFLLVEHASPLHGTLNVSGAKNAALCIMASLILARGKSIIRNIPASADVRQMIALLQDLGADVMYDAIGQCLEVSTDSICNVTVRADIMGKMRASILVMGPLLARYQTAQVPFPGGCDLTQDRRPIDYHLYALRKLGVQIIESAHNMEATYVSRGQPDHVRVVLDYPSVGATENVLMFAALGARTITLVNAALEPEVLDLITVLRKMGASIICEPGAVIHIVGVAELHALDHEIITDRLEAGSLLLAAAITKGSITLPNAQAWHLDAFLEKLRYMGHHVETGTHGIGIRLIATKNPQAVSFKTGPYPSFPTDLQAPMMAAQAVALGVSVIEETVFDKRYTHISELKKLGASISCDGTKAYITGVDTLNGTLLVAGNIRASCALVIAGLAAHGQTAVFGLHHWRRGYDNLEGKLKSLGAIITIERELDILPETLIEQSSI